MPRFETPQNGDDHCHELDAMFKHDVAEELLFDGEDSSSAVYP